MRARVGLWVALVGGFFLVVYATPPPSQPEQLATPTAVADELLAVHAQPTSAAMYPPSPESFVHDAGVYTFPVSAFSVWINAGWTSTQEDGFDFYPVVLEESGTDPRLFTINDETGLALASPPAPAGWDPAAWTEQVYGPSPSWLDAAELATWYEQRDPKRIRIRARLLPLSQETAYLQYLSDSYAAAETSTDPAFSLPIDLNTVAFAATDWVPPEIWMPWIYRPDSVTWIDLFEAPTPLDSWTLLGAYASPYLLSGVSVAIEESPFRVLALAESARDTDGDGLADGREQLIYGTNPNVADTDEDGLADGLEILTYALNALAADSDGDGLNDNLELQRGANPWIQDSDGDWVSDGYEVDHEGDPVDPSVFPTLLVRVNDGDYYAKSADLSLTVPGLVADRLLVSEQPDLDSPNLSTFAPPITYTLQNTTAGIHGLFAVPIRDTPDGEELGSLIYGSTVVDTEPPVLSVTEPLDQSIVTAPAIDVRGTITDNGGSARPWVNGRWVQGVAAGEFWLEGFDLLPGLNTLTITAKDQAGNSIEEVLTVTFDPTGDTEAPVIDLGIPETAHIGDVEFLPVVGTCSEEYAAVEYTVANDGSVVGPFAVNVVNGEMSFNIPLQSGQNTVSLTATDAAGNTGMCNYVLVRDEALPFSFATPSNYEVINNDDASVSVTAPLAFANAAVTINGQAATPSSGSSAVTFLVENLPLTPGLNRITATAAWDSETWYGQLALIGYEILSFEEAHNQFSETVEQYADGGYEKVTTNPSGYEETWDADTLEIQRETYFERSTETLTPPDVSPVTTSEIEPPVLTSWQSQFPPSHGRFEDWTLTMAYPPAEYGVVGGGAEHRIENETVLRFRKHSPEGGNQLVILHFENMSYRHESYTVDPGNITLFGQSGFRYLDDEIGFLVELEMGRTYTLDRSAFTWPAYDLGATGGGPGSTISQVRGQLLEYSAWGNAIPDVYMTNGRISTWEGEDEHPDSSPIALGYEMWEFDYGIFPDRDFSLDECHLRILNSEGELVYFDDELSAHSGEHSWSDWKVNRNTVAQPQWVDPHDSPFEATVTVKNGGMSLVSNPPRELSVAAYALVGGQLSGIDQHLNTIGSMLGQLHYSPSVDDDLRKEDAVLADKKFIWYSHTHGVIGTDGQFKGLGPYGEPPASEVLFPNDLPDNLRCRLVFLNACLSGSTDPGSNSQAFESQFGAEVFIGWKGTVGGTTARAFAERFFQNLDNHRSVYQAKMAAHDSFAPGGTGINSGWYQIDQNLVIRGNENFQIDLARP